MDADPIAAAAAPVATDAAAYVQGDAATRAGAIAAAAAATAMSPRAKKVTCPLASASGFTASKRFVPASSTKYQGAVPSTHHSDNAFTAEDA